MNKIAAVIILYNPKKDIIKNIKNYLLVVDKLYIVENSKISFSYIENKDLKKVKIINQLENIGVAKALNIVLNYAHRDGYEWLFTFDQDTFFNEKDIKIFLKHIENYPKKDVVIFSPLHNKKDISNRGLVETNYVMTSANLINVKKSIKIGKFDENLFIDEVDHEFCLKIKEKNYKTILDTSIAVEHQLGDNNKFLFFKYKEYENIRIYYMIRNFLYVRNKYKNYDNIFIDRKIFIIKFFLKQFLLAKNKIQKIKMFIIGYKDYKKNKMGKYEG